MGKQFDQFNDIPQSLDWGSDAPSARGQYQNSKSAPRSLPSLPDQLSQPSLSIGTKPVNYGGVSPASPRRQASAKPVKRRSRSRSRWNWPLVFFGTLAVFGTVGGVAFVWLTSLPPLPDCNSISALSADMERLYCAREAARSGKVADLVAGVNLVKGWTAERPLYHEAEALLKDCSVALMAIAQSTVERNELDEAVKIAGSIPVNSPLYAEAQTAIATWQDEWTRGEAIYATARAALKAQKWNEAAAQVPALGRLNTLYWRRDRASDLTQEILAERGSRETLLRAQGLAKGDNLEKLGQAIAVVAEVDSQTFAAPEAKANLMLWSQSLIKAGMQRWQQGDLDGAVALVRYIPPDLELDATSRDFVRFSHAQGLIDEYAHQRGPSLQHIWGLMEAVASVREIPPSSPFYAISQAKVQDWQAQIEDLTQLQYATVTASLGQHTAYELAIAQATSIAADRPKRVQAQTLIAHWQQQIERIEDQPYLLAARTLAEPGTIPALRAAIAFAQQIPLGRPLRIDAQTAIADWNRQIETIEDQPLLNEALALANRGKLSDAIQAAKKIRSGRALYDRAQTAIASWRAQIRAVQIAQDRKILDKAVSLAAVDSLTLAIETASQIGSDRPLYGEARAAIAQWRAERAAIWETWADQEQESETYSEDDSSGEYEYEDYEDTSE
jgi:soluble cytochrome b562